MSVLISWERTISINLMLIFSSQWRTECMLNSKTCLLHWLPKLTKICNRANNFSCPRTCRRMNNDDHILLRIWYNICNVCFYAFCRLDKFGNTGVIRLIFQVNLRTEYRDRGSKAQGMITLAPRRHKWERFWFMGPQLRQSEQKPGLRLQIRREQRIGPWNSTL